MRRNLKIGSKLPRYWDVCYGCFRTIRLTKAEWDYQIENGGMYYCDENGDCTTPIDTSIVWDFVSEMAKS